jgi:anti-anti-sigma factor
MNFKVNIKDSTLLLKVTGEMTAHSLQGIKEAVAEGMLKAERAELDLGGVEDMDSAGFQLIYAIKKHADSRRQEFNLKTCSSAVMTYMRTYNMLDQFRINAPDPEGV